MKRILRLYQNVGRSGEKYMNRTIPNPFKELKPPIWQEPGGAQYYRVEMEPFLPDDVKYAIKQPKTFANSTINLSYLPEVHKIVEEHLKEILPANSLDDKPIDLNLTMNEFYLLAKTSPEVMSLAKSGELEKLRAESEALEEHSENEIYRVLKNVDSVVDKLNQREIDILTTFEEALPDISAKKVQFMVHNDNFASRNWAVFKKALEDASVSQENKEKVKEAMKELAEIYQVLKEGKIIKTDLFKNYAKFYRKSGKGEYSSYLRERDAFNGFLNEIADKPAELREEYKKQLNTITEIANSKVQELKDVYIKRKRVEQDLKLKYSEFYDADAAPEAENNYSIKSALLGRLAGDIIVKENRYRYQTEQYERFLISLYSFPIKGSKTLDEFCVDYSKFVIFLADASNNFKCPKIAANYDDYQERSTKPINAMIFYFFFSANKATRSFAQFLLSTVRYPSQKVKRAYMRFFNNNTFY